MLPIKIVDETAPLEAVILGIANSFGGTPKLEETYDPKSREHIRQGTFPIEEYLVNEMEAVKDVLERHGVHVYRPKSIDNYNQIFARDISFVIDDKLVVPPVTDLRKEESDGIQFLIDQVDKVLLPELDKRMEGGDVMVWKGNLFVGYSKEADFEAYEVARTNEAGLTYLKETFPHYNVKGFELVKSDENPRENALHLDCCFQPVGHDKAVIYEGGFKNQKDFDFLIDFFGEDNVFTITQEEMYEMNSNFFSISPEVVITDASFKRLNAQLNAWGIKTEAINYREVAKMEGLLRCTTMPLRRKDV